MNLKKLTIICSFALLGTAVYAQGEAKRPSVMELEKKVNAFKEQLNTTTDAATRQKIEASIVYLNAQIFEKSDAYAKLQTPPVTPELIKMRIAELEKAKLAATDPSIVAKIQTAIDEYKAMQ